eukprot:752239-Hanusia_phi.AAC.2
MGSLPRDPKAWPRDSPCARRIERSSWIWLRKISRHHCVKRGFFALISLAVAPVAERTVVISQTGDLRHPHPPFYKPRPSLLHLGSRLSTTPDNS